MRNLIFIFKCLLGPLVILHCAGVAVEATPSRHQARFYLDFGEKLFKENNREDSITPFLKALIFDTSQTSAADRLREVAQEVDRTTRLKVLRVVELAEYYQFLLSHVRGLESSNASMDDFIYENTEKEEIKNALASLRRDIEKTSREGDFSTSLMTPDEWDETGSLEGDLSDAILRRTDDLADYFSFLQNKNGVLRDIKKDILTSRRVKRQGKIAAQLTGQVQEIALELASKDMLLEKQNRDIRHFRDEMKAMRVQFSSAAGQWQETEVKVKDLTRELAGMSLELYEKNKNLGDKGARIEALENDLLEAKERWQLVQRIMQEKDGHIRQLEDEVMTLQGAGAFDGTRIGEDGLASLEGKVQHLSDEMNTQRQTSQEKIVMLEERFEDLSAKYSKLEESLRQKDEQVAALRGSLQDKDMTISKFKKVFVSKDQKLMELNGVILIYKGMLDETQTLLKEKARILKDLEDQLNTISIGLGDSADGHDAQDPMTKTSKGMDHVSIPVSMGALSSQDVLRKTQKQVGSVLR